MTKIKAILFDLDNTLIDFIKLKQMAVEASVSAMIDAGLKKSKEKIISVIDKVYRENGIEYQHVFDDVLKELIGKVDYKILAAGISAYRKIKSAYLDPYPNVIPTLVELIRRGYKLCIVSDAPKMQIWTRLCEAKLQHFFDVVVESEDLERKPSPLPFQKALELLKAKPEEVMMVGDMIGRDIVGAHKMGIKTVYAEYGDLYGKIIGINRKKVKTDIKPDHIIKDISELLKIV